MAAPNRIAEAEEHMRANVRAARIILAEPRYAGGAMEAWARLVLEGAAERQKRSRSDPGKLAGARVS